MRLDKFLAEVGLGSRKEVKQLIKKKCVTVNEKIVTSDKFQVSETNDVIKYEGELLQYQAFFYYLLHKPAGVITATKDAQQQTVMDLLPEVWREGLFPVGRLDKDTEGLLLITNDGELAHQLLSPKKHVEKEYYARVAGVMTAEDVATFAAGIELSEVLLQPADLKILKVDEAAEISEITLIIHEGKFHQVKRMVHAVGKEVTYLKRLRMGSLVLDEALALGEYRELTEEEVKGLKQGSGF
ncbi:16S rRNA pseudouridine516 synthase [Enterococcus sp. PF1-24]|uniref:pseudouridine synthase n=1 Tax=unclassified Enterococcus TaxID=2608891 RepID=UPI0024731C2E|nr:MULTISPECIES: pseudouridine synthase [unclassified Enterococcus]MDH6363401.1 16S rRNA pseudouridine516 synthase [Enterococcus sp. PFB1-1]MDH6400495.1 16S rRNA pseudouridine516 synthase [Enterococcus sp. PF1-24]